MATLSEQSESKCLSSVPAFVRSNTSSCSTRLTRCAAGPLTLLDSALPQSLPVNLLKSALPFLAPICGFQRTYRPQIFSRNSFISCTYGHRRLSAGNKRLITPVESALTENAPATPLESALTKNPGGGGRVFQTEGFRLSLDIQAFDAPVVRRWDLSRLASSPTRSLTSTRSRANIAIAKQGNRLPSASVSRLSVSCVADGGDT